MGSLDKGFTLIELLLALLIVAFAVTALLSLFISSIFLNMANRGLTIAMSHAQYALEHTTNKSFSNIENETWNIESYGLVPLDSESIDITVTDSGSYIKNIIATVNWTDRGIINRSIALETNITGQ